MRCKDLTLYRTPSCPFCHAVLAAAEGLGIDLRQVDISTDAEARARVLWGLGRKTVPVLGIPTPGGERLLPESRDIIAYLRDHCAHGPCHP